MSYQDRDTSALLGDPMELYKFTLTGAAYCYTSADTEQTYLGDTYTPEAIKRTAPEQQRDPSSSKLRITVRRDNPVALLFCVFAPCQSIWLTIYRYHGGDSETIAMWTGRVRLAGWTPKDAVLECDPIVGQMKREGLRLQYQLQCNHMLYGAKCGLNSDSWKVIATITHLSDITVRAAAFATVADNWLRAGMLVKSYDQRMITSHTGDTVTLFTPMEGLSIGDNVTVYAGCDRWHGTCKDKFANTLNYGGFPYIPNHNPFNGIG